MWLPDAFVDVWPQAGVRDRHYDLRECKQSMAIVLSDIIEQVDVARQSFLLIDVCHSDQVCRVYCTLVVAEFVLGCDSKETLKQERIPKCMVGDDSFPQ